MALLLGLIISASDLSGTTVLLKLLFFPFALILLVIALPKGWAEQVEGLYEVAVPVASQSRSDLRIASQNGLETVFIRVSGSTEVIKHPDIARAINRAKSYTKQFQFEWVKKQPGLELEAVNGATGEGLAHNSEQLTEQLYVLLEFDQAQIDQILRNAGLPLWSSNRPSMLVWIVIEDLQGRRIASADRDADLLQMITDQARRRGLALKLPVLDLQDMVALSADDLWQMDFNQVQSAVQRYNADSVLLGRISQLSSGQFLGSWMYQFNNEVRRFDGDMATSDDYFAMAVDQVADWLAAEYAVVPVNIAEGGILMRLTGINSFLDYAQAVNYLEGISAIRHAHVIHLQGDEIIVRLTAEGLLPQLQQVFELDKQLLPATSAVYQGNYAIALDYQWPQAAAHTNRP